MPHMYVCRCVFLYVRISVCTSGGRELFGVGVAHTQSSAGVVAALVDGAVAGHVAVLAAIATHGTVLGCMPFALACVARRAT